MSLIMLALAAEASFTGAANVVDGDTLRVGSRRVRIFGVDAPELSQTCDAGASKVACGALARNWLRSRVEGRSLRCSAVDIDRYGRTVARCSVNGTDVGRALVGAGWAVAYRRYSSDYVVQEARARAGRVGIWAFRFEWPDAYRRREGASASRGRAPNPRCTVKGNVSSSGVRIYHLPGGRDYDAVVIDPHRGERWFCSVAEATAAGWRRAR